MLLNNFISNTELTNGTLKYIENKLLSKLIHHYKYIDFRILWYDDPDNPDENTWLDIEGIGYGWLWINRTIKEQKKVIKQLTKDYYHNRKNKNVYIIHNKTNIQIYFDQRAEDAICVLTLSNEQIDCF